MYRVEREREKKINPWKEYLRWQYYRGMPMESIKSTFNCSTVQPSMICSILFFQFCQRGAEFKRPQTCVSVAAHLGEVSTVGFSLSLFFFLFSYLFNWILKTKILLDDNLSYLHIWIREKEGGKSKPVTTNFTYKF